MAAVRVRAGAAALTLAGAALILVWRLAPAVAPPLYDGCITEPYRQLGGNPSPSATSQPYPAGNNFQPAEVITGESPAQAQILMMEGTFVSGEPFTVSVAPIAAPQPPPSGDRFDGNVYRIVATSASGKALQPVSGQPVTIVLRATASNGPARTIVRLEGTTWTPLKTFSAGCGDEYEAVSTKLGVFATVESTSAAPAQPGGFPAAALIPIIIVVLAGAVYALLRLNRPRRARR